MFIVVCFLFYPLHFINCTNQTEDCLQNITDILLGNETNEIFLLNPKEMLEPWTMNEYFMLIVMMYIVTFVVGVSANIMVIAGILKDKGSRNATNVFLVSLASADLLLLGFCAPLDIAHYFVVQWDTRGIFCKLAAYIETVSAFASVLNLLAVSIER